MEDLREIRVKVDNRYHTILNEKEIFNTLKSGFNYEDVIDYQVESKTLLKELEKNLQSKNLKKCVEIKNRVILLDSYISMFFLIESIKEISC